MADNLYFSRNTKVFINRNSLFYEIPILDGYSFSQGQNTSEISLSEASDSDGASRRGRQVFNDSYAPSEWSFTTYMRPFIAASGGTVGTAGATDSTVGAIHHAVEEALWDAFVDADNDGGGITADATNLDVNFSESNKTTIGTFDLYFILNWSAAGTDQKVYKIAGAVANEASMDFDINGIATIAWSGMGGQLTDEGNTIPYDAAYASATDLIYEGISSTTNYIRNKLTTLTLAENMTEYSTATYDIVLTGGNVTISNNIDFLTPETIGTVNQPLGHVTGTRSVTGNFTAYLNYEDSAGDSVSQLFVDIAENPTVITNDFTATFTIGGATAPKVIIALAQAHLEIPTLNVADVIGVEVNFHGLPSTISGTDEVTIQYVGIAL